MSGYHAPSAEYQISQQPSDTTLRDLCCFVDLKIVVRNLQKTSISALFYVVHLNTPLLATAVIDLKYPITDHSTVGGAKNQMGEDHGCNLVKILGCLLCIEQLELENYFLQA
ncbi:hypothetical protein ACLOJK_035388 [Asimina triloba]